MSLRTYPRSPPPSLRPDADTQPALALVTGPILPALCSEQDDSSASTDVEWERTIVLHCTAVFNTPAGPNAWPQADTRRPATITIPDSQSIAVPPVPPRLRDHVVRGEFVDFAKLLPWSLSHQHEQCAITLPVGDGQGAHSVQLAVATQLRGALSVISPRGWRPGRIMAKHHPDRVSELISYQHLILDTHQEFNTESVLNYDSAFRSYMAENPHARWDQVNTMLWSTKMLQGVRPSCPQCTKTHSRDCA